MSSVYIVHFIYFCGSQCCLKLSPHSETKQKFKRVDGRKSCAGSAQLLSCLLSVLVDCVSFRKTSEMARVQCLDCQLTRNGNECKVLCILSLCMVPTLCFQALCLYQSLKKSSNFFSSVTFSSFIVFSS